MKIEIYTKENCIFCIKAKSFLENKNLKYEEYKLGKDFSINNIKESFPLQKTFPIILINDELIGGYNDFMVYIDNYNINFGLKLIQE